MRTDGLAGAVRGASRRTTCPVPGLVEAPN
jgi:hypothetical protein